MYSVFLPSALPILPSTWLTSSFVECREMDRSNDEPGPSRESVFSEEFAYPAANVSSRLTKVAISRIVDKYAIPTGAWFAYWADEHDRVYHRLRVPAGHGSCCTGISEAAFKCGLRLPLLPILKRLFEEMGIALGQMDPNGFTHINAFQHRCLVARVEARTSLFWHQYDFRRNPKSNGFYTIVRRNGRPDWVQTNSNNKGTHDKWFYISGPRVARFSVWRVVDPKEAPLTAPAEGDVLDHRLLCEAIPGQLSLASSRDSDWPFALWGNGNISAYIF